MGNKVEADKDLLKKLIVTLGREIVEYSKPYVRKIFEYPFNSILLAAFSIGGLGDDFAFKALYTIRFRASNAGKTTAEYLASRSDKELEELINELKPKVSKDDMKNTLKGLTELNKKYNLDKETDLSHIDPDEFYNELKQVRGFGAEEGEILPWAICDLIRLWNLKVPRELKLSKNTRDCLAKLGLSPSDFSVEEYPYVDAVMFELKSDCK